MRYRVFRHCLRDVCLPVMLAIQLQGLQCIAAEAADPPQELSGEQIMRESQIRHEAHPYVFERQQYILTDRHGGRTVRQARRYWRREADGQADFLLVFDQPPELRGVAILAGRDAPVFQCDFGRVGCAICFDLNFQPILDDYVQSRPDLLLFSSMYHGGLMQPYWAYACRAHVLTACAGLPCAVISPVGHLIAESTNYYDFVTARINLDCIVIHLDFHWDKIAAIKQAYGPGVTVFDPGYLGAVLISCNAEDMTCADLVRDYDLELLDDYFQRSLDHRLLPGNMEP